SHARAREPVPVGSEILVSYRLPAHAPTGGVGRAAAELSAQQMAVQSRLELGMLHSLTTLEAANGAGPDLLAAPTGTDVDALVAARAADPRVAAVQRNYYVELQWNGGTPSDPYYPAQWTLADFGVPEAWAALT